MIFPRASGILLHPTSLPGNHGIGDLGDEAYRFADFLVAAGQSHWQVLPLGPIDETGSPYSSYSAFGGNTLLISPERLIENALLTKGDVSNLPAPSSSRVNFAAAEESKAALLRKAFTNCGRASHTDLSKEFEAFAAQNVSWLDDYALFRALKDLHAGKPWHQWDHTLAWRESSALAAARKQLREQIEAEKFYQLLFFKQWAELKSYCNRSGLTIIGDIPMFVAHDSADVWTHPDQFKLDANGNPIVMAGVPPDYFSETGQYWGNPIFGWERMRSDGFTWWIERMRAALNMFDYVRIDHFRGFAASWEIPAGDDTAERGRWVEVPGRELFIALAAALGELPIIAEDLGVITPEVERLRDDFGFPGMRVLQFAFSGDASNIHLPHNFPQPAVVYTGTHDNDTAVGWFNNLAPEQATLSCEQLRSEREFCLRYLNSEGKEIHWDFIRAALASVANTAIIPLQDVLGLGSDARMNLPNSTSGNWQWRLEKNCLSDQLAERLRHLSELYRRSPTA